MEFKKDSILLNISDDKKQEWIYDKLQKKYKLFIANTHNEAEKKIIEKTVGLVLMDIDCQKIDGLKIIKLIREIGQSTEILLMGSTKSIKNAVKVIKIRARDCIEKPYEIDQLEKKINRIFQDRGVKSDIHKISKEFGKYYIFENMVGNDKKIRKVYELIQKYSETDGTVLIQGESGTGKELAAKAIHKRSFRKTGPFVVINCAALPGDLMTRELFGHIKGAFTGADVSRPGKIETADTGTVFFDDIDSLDIHMQAKILRLIQEKEFERLGSTKVNHVDVRFIAATNKDLMEMVKCGTFREDLYYRFNVLPLNIPALRERKKDICMLLKYFLRIYSKTTGKPVKKFSENAVKTMSEYEWPGNVRELKNLVERLLAITKGYVIELQDVSSSVTRKKKCAEGTLKEMLWKFEEECILSTLEGAGWNRKKAARKLGIHRNTLLNKINAFRLKISDKNK
ncbi:MAG: sigma-54-dependent Fis family transcriptional regulator [Deltaproteobacteria bacterium]|nr:sigma-54-dependent Fis family transcriptional regulator [Deltaproteobacteria bacterium]MBW2181639.1 sigma-54-dependent Fis family transcriptional regulator [Deltaproteobacteria bacterium]MBW2364025.1 sigma-54-dependent Fis family transcriptional regulator [Deltaproteobacteria bacterium]